MKKRRPFKHSMVLLLFAGLFWPVRSPLTKACALPAAEARSQKSTTTPLTLNKKDIGYRGIWYMDQPSEDEWV